VLSACKIFVDGTQIASKVPSNGKVHFDLGSSNAIRVAKNSNKVVSVRVDLNPVTDETNTAKEFKLALYGLEAKSVATGTDLPSTEVVGVSNSDTINTASVVDGEIYTVAETVPTVVTKTISGSLSAGTDKAVYKFSVSADASSDVYLKEFTISTSGSLDTTAGNFVISKVEEWSSEEATTITGNSIVFDDAQVISAGTTKTFTVYADITAVANDDTLDVKIKDTALTYTPVNGVEYSSVHGTAGASFVWSDDSASDNGNLTSAQWFDSWNVRGLDTATSTLKE